MERNASFWLHSIEIKGKWIVCVFVCSEGGKECEKERGKMIDRFWKANILFGKVFTEIRRR